jgi:predicted NACHT family NTPase
MSEVIFKYLEPLIQNPALEDFLDRRLVGHTEWANKFTHEEYFDFWQVHHDPSEILEKDKIILIIGEAGSGKTTLLREISSIRAKECSEALKTKANVSFPIYINLSQFKEGDLLQYFQRILPPDILSLIQKRPEGFANWRFVYLLDGLDEIPFNDIPERLRTIIRESMDFKTNSDLIILSSRPIFYESYKSTFDLWSIPVYHLAPLTWEQISRYCKSKGCESDELLEQSVRLGFEELLRNPLNLKLTADLLKNEGQLPATKSDLFEKIVHWKTSQRTIRPFEQKGLLEGLRDLALGMEMLHQNYLTELDTAKILHEVTGVGPSSPGELIAELELTGIIVKSEDIVRFEHRALSEYLAAARLRNESIWKLREYLGFVG